MHIELWDVDRLIPFEKNAKKHSPDQVKRLAATIKKFGWHQPIVVWTDGSIIAGHGRRLAAIELGLKKVPVLVRSDLTQEQADAARISDNAVASTEYDTKTLQEELQRIMAIEAIDFTADDLGLADKDKKLLLEELDVPELTAIMEDTHGEIEKQKAEDAERVAKADKETVKLADAFGFKVVTLDQSRAIARQMVQGEALTGLTGADALVELLTRAIQ